MLQTMTSLLDEDEEVRLLRLPLWLSKQAMPAKRVCASMTRDYSIVCSILYALHAPVFNSSA